MKGKSIKIERRLKNPCYNEKTGEDCAMRALGCRETCNRYKIYETLKRVEAAQRAKRYGGVSR